MERFKTFLTLIPYSFTPPRLNSSMVHSVTDFENKLKRLLVIFRGLFSIWQKLKPTLVNF